MLNEREFRERGGGVSQNLRSPIGPYEKRAVRSPDAQLPSPLPSTLRVGRLIGSSSTARQYNISITEALPAEANVCQLGGPSSPISAQPTSNTSHLRTSESRWILNFFSTESAKSRDASKTASGVSWDSASCARQGSAMRLIRPTDLDDANIIQVGGPYCEAPQTKSRRIAGSRRLSIPMCNADSASP